MLHRAPGSQYSTQRSVRPERNRYGNTASPGMALRRSLLLHCCCCTATNWDTTDAFAATQRPTPKGKYQMARGREYRASLVVSAAAALAVTALRRLHCYQLGYD